ncbi:5-methyltetrahydropteroyltriglutamate--homocysteine S-methyltransferase [Arboricoccus pini]|nr:5-methyltetrahydropteroyltriglutamate--homocysteine S-methyltransferase [Arboricoccus pini]
MNDSTSLPTATLGVPRMGPRRELKQALERHWTGASSDAELLDAAAALRAAHWARQHAQGITRIPVGDFSLYDHVLDLSMMVGVLPTAHAAAELPPLETYFALARGRQGRPGLPALEMTKWFDTNYHYLVPEFAPGQSFKPGPNKVLAEFLEARALGYRTRPVLLGPVTYLKLGKGESDPLRLLDGLLPVYVHLLRQLAEAGADEVQIDEPWLVMDADEATQQAYVSAYGRLARELPGLELMLTTYFGELGDNLETALALPVSGLHLDLSRAPHQLDQVLRHARPDHKLSLGVIDGRNVWRADLSGLLDRLEPVRDRLGPERLVIASSCSLLHVPTDLDLETDLDPDLKGWLAFAVQKMGELAILGRGLALGREAVRAELAETDKALAGRQSSAKVNDPSVASRVSGLDATMAERRSPYAARRQLQRAALRLPPFPTTTIGSFPQTAELRQARARHAKGAMTDADYADFLEAMTVEAVRWQEEIGIDVLVHGEFERNDMVQYFGERLQGYAFTAHGWVQSYGSRYVRPPVIFGDVGRPEPMTVRWSSFAQSLTTKPVKGMLTGPVTMLQWSFVRDDLPRQAVCRQIALALRDEVLDLEAAGIGCIQIDEPAFREGLPLRRKDWADYLAWAVQCFKIAAGGVADKTQIHTHMCYAEFNDIIDSIAAMDADVISIETSRSRMELLDAFVGYRYPNEIGPGVYDIHSPRVPDADEIRTLLDKALSNLAPEQLWVNPDCGLKTRGWAEVRPALLNMVAAAKALRLASVPNRA